MTTLPLSGYLVVDLSSGIPGAYCTKLLADSGAHVVKVEDRAAILRTWSASGTEIRWGRRCALLVPGIVQAQRRRRPGRRRRSRSPPRAARQGRRRGLVTRWAVAAHPSLPPDARAAHSLAVTAVSPFGLDGPWADRPATELTLQGMVGRRHRARPRRPFHAPARRHRRSGREWLTGTAGGHRHPVHPHGASRSGRSSTCPCWRRWPRLTYYPVTFLDMVGRPFAPAARITLGVEATSDGLVGVGVGTGQQWLDFCVLVGHPEWMEDRAVRNRTHLQPEIAA
ncbi:MAG: CoA transferase [Acidimicrobiales bacterium]